MEVSALLNALDQQNIDFYTGVPDSLLQPLCNSLYKRWETDPKHHIVAHNEGGCVGLAAGYHLATGKTPCVYLQNSGIGNIINPQASLASPLVYGIPILYIIGWRGQAGTKDEPQHVFQGLISEALLQAMDITFLVLRKTTTAQEIQAALALFAKLFADGKSCAFLVEKGALEGGEALSYKNPYLLNRESVIETIIAKATEDIIISSTGKISRELFEVREAKGEWHRQDFLTVGSMGHSSMIALGVAIEKPKRRVWCIDGDGSFLMHLGAAGLIGSVSPANYIHVVLNNAAHETVGGMPTYAQSTNLPALAKAAGYKNALQAENEQELELSLKKLISMQGPSFLEVRVSLEARENLGRPTTTPQQNKTDLMKYLAKQ